MSTRPRSGPASRRSSTDFAPRNRALLARRDELQQQLDEWHEKNPGPVGDQAAYVQLLRDLGYLVDEPADFTIETSDVDEEVAVQAGPQLVVPVLNARFAANAANARWGSLYDALYGTDALPEDGGQERGPSYNPKRGAAVIARARAFLDEHFPLEQGSHADATGYSTEDGAPDGQARTTARPGSPTRRSTSATAATRPTPRACCWSTTGCTSRSRSTAPTTSARTTPPA